LTPLLSYSSSIYSAADNVLEQDDYLLVNTTLNWTSTDGRYSVSLWGRNLTNEAVLASFQTSEVGALGNYRLPRNYGVTFSAQY
jgi:hypothetical protein